MRKGGKDGEDDSPEIDVLDLEFPATTDSERLGRGVRGSAADKMTVVFATYQSIGVISAAQSAHGVGEFDLIICDEAHRTTGVTLTDKEESNFVKVHDNAVIQGKKRLYMTATPRIYAENIKRKARIVEAIPVSMDNEDLFGKDLFRYGFSSAVRNGLLTDYKVVVLMMDEELVSASVQRRLASEDNELQLDDATKIIGCYKILTKENLKKDLKSDPLPMKRALGFCGNIEKSKLIKKEFVEVVKEFLEAGEKADAADTVDETKTDGRLKCEVKHVDGTFDAKERFRELNWLSGEAENECRILTNARCLSEGVDLPSLDAIIFFHPRKSQIDIVQSVGRVMRKAEEKKMGYVILPVGIPAGVEPEEALNDNTRYRVVWQTLNALRSHDDRFEAIINQASLGQDISDKIEIIIGSDEVGEGFGERIEGRQLELNLRYSEAIMAKIVKKCGRREYLEDWAADVAAIAQAHITRLSGIVKDTGGEAYRAFHRFVKELREDLNEAITEGDAMEMLAQHMITRPIFDELFKDHPFSGENPVSRAMHRVLEELKALRIDREAKDLTGLYESVRRQAEGITDSGAKQRLMAGLYEKFFQGAFPRVVEKLGIIYTPIEVVDFIIRSVEEIVWEEFGERLGADGIQILDPFTGTGTFIARLLQLGVMSMEEIEKKYRRGIHANEIVLLAYYIAAVNIESVYQDLVEDSRGSREGGESPLSEEKLLMEGDSSPSTPREFENMRETRGSREGGESPLSEEKLMEGDSSPSTPQEFADSRGGGYVPFEGICLTDTFRMNESEDLIAYYLVDNTERRRRQKKSDIQIIVGNPPYSVGQKSENDDAANVKYPSLDQKIRDTYAKHSSGRNLNSLYDSYIRAIRWASTRIGDRGVIGFVTNSGWIEGKVADGLRKCLASEFTNLYVLNLRGDINNRQPREGGNIFDSRSKTGTAITIFVKNPIAKEHGRIFYHDIGDNLKTKQKLDRIAALRSIAGVREKEGWREIIPDRYGDWINQREERDQRDKRFASFLRLESKTSIPETTLFSLHSCGLKTNRDKWCYNPSKIQLQENISRTIAFYNAEVERRQTFTPQERKKLTIPRAPKEISWSSSLRANLKRDQLLALEEGVAIQSLYRPFTKRWLHYSRSLNERVYQMPKIFPEPGLENRAIVVTGIGASADFSCLMADCIPDVQTIKNDQCFPLWRYRKIKKGSLETVEYGKDIIEGPSGRRYIRESAVTEKGLEEFRREYPELWITAEDIFLYAYGLLHSPEYRVRFGSNLSKELPRLPLSKHFEAFREAGKALAELHTNYETVEPYPVTVAQGDFLTMIEEPETFYRVTKMTFGQRERDNKKVKDKTSIIYNNNITLRGIPLEAYEYVVNGKSGLEWVMSCQNVSIDDKASGIMSDGNLYGIETVGDPSYPLRLLERVIMVSLETLRIVKGLPLLELKE